MVAWESKSQYFGESESVADRLWEEISIDNGTVALDDGYVQEMGLPVSQRFPWDQDKGLYLLNGFHSMHCLVSWPCYRSSHKHDKTTDGINRKQLDKQFYNSIEVLSEVSQRNTSCIAWTLYARTYYAMPMIHHATQASNQAADQGRDKFVNAEVGISSKYGLNLTRPVGDTLIRMTLILTH